MGNFSNDPQARLTESVGKHYVGVRMQQAVPVLDADWNLLEDLRRREFEILGTSFIGNGTPVGSDGFHIFAVPAANDFAIRAGLAIANGKLTENAADVQYSTQPNFGNPSLFPPLAPIATPTTDALFVVYLDVFEVEIDSQKDPALIDSRIGIETAIRIKRDWAVRVARAVDYPQLVATAPAGHYFYKLATLTRVLNNPAITDDMIADERDTDVSLRRQVEFRAPQTGVVLVDSTAMHDTLVACRDNIRDFIQFLTTKFVDPATSYVAVEVAGIDSLSVVANVADQGVSLLDANSMDTQTAFKFFGQLLEAEKRFVTVWKNFLLPLNKSAGKVYGNAYTGMIQTIDSFLTGTPVPPFISISDALKKRNLMQAKNSQDQINSSVGSEVARPVGFLTLTYLGSPTPIIIKNQPFDLRFRVSGSVTPVDTIKVDTFIDPAWGITLKNGDGSLPFQLQLGPGTGSSEFIVTVQTPNVSNVTTKIALKVSATHNQAGLAFTSGQLVLLENTPPPAGGDAFTITVVAADVALQQSVYQIPVGGFVANLTFRITNNTNSSRTVNLVASTLPAGWTMSAGGSNLNNVVIPALGQKDLILQFLPPNAVGQSTDFDFSAKDGVNVLADLSISFTTIAKS